ncbi:MAG: hypothetical protein ABW005_01005 [Burkholderiaceae bacterium]
MPAIEQIEAPPSWNVPQRLAEPLDSAALDVGYEGAFPFLAEAADDGDTAH